MHSFLPLIMAWIRPIVELIIHANMYHCSPMGNQCKRGWIWEHVQHLLIWVRHWPRPLMLAHWRPVQVSRTQWGYNDRNTTRQKDATSSRRTTSWRTSHIAPSRHE